MPSSIFEGQRKLNSQYQAKTFTELSGATTAATAVLVMRFDAIGKLQFFDNTTSSDLQLLLVHPEADSAVVANRLPWFELPALRVMDVSVAMSNTSIPAGTLLYAYCTSAPVSGKLRVFIW